MSRYNTPLRYPGGKQKLTPFVREVIVENDLLGGHYAEPYAGGAGVAIELLLSGVVSHIHLNDACERVYAFWRSVMRQPDRLCSLIAGASLTVDEWLRQREIYRSPSQHDQLTVGFSTFYLNRCNRSGILSGGLIGGLEQTGKWKIDARFTRNELIRRVEAIAARRKDITVRNLDAELYIAEYLPHLPANTLVYFDPPYFRKADRLYDNHYAPTDHQRIASAIQYVELPWMVSYDSAPEIARYYAKRRKFRYDLQYNAKDAYKGEELIIFSDQVQVPATSAIATIDVAVTEMSARVRRPRHQRAHGSRTRSQAAR
jgi:DNA adenine methylase